MSRFARDQYSGEDFAAHPIFIAAAIIFVLLLLHSAHLVFPLVFPVLSVVLLTGAGLMAFVAWERAESHGSRRITSWDIAGLLAFLGFLAGILADPEDVLPLLERRPGTKGL